jgi:hypothetical protein
MTILALLLAAVPSGAEYPVQKAVLTAVAAEWKRAVRFLCVDVVAPAPDRGVKFWHIRLVGVDPAAAAIPSLGAGAPAVVPRSACSVGGDYDGPIVLRATSRGGGATVSLGPVTWVNAKEARIVVLTWSGGLTHTFTEWKLRRESDTWTARGSSIILQE